MTFTPVGLFHDIPPSPAVSFLARRPAIPTVVVADHSHEFNNKFYHSHFDTSMNITEHLYNTATGIARALYSLAADGNPLVPLNTISANYDMVTSRLQAWFNFKVDQLWKCLTQDLKCPLLESLLGSFFTIVVVHFSRHTFCQCYAFILRWRIWIFTNILFY